MTSPSIARATPARLFLMTAVLFIAYLCVAMSLPVVPLFVARDLGFGNLWGGLAVGAVFLATILSRGWAGRLMDQQGSKRAAIRGLLFYAAGAAVAVLAGMVTARPETAYAILVLSRLLVGLGESLVAVAIVGWGIGIVGPGRSGRVLALGGAAIYGGFAVGGPLGLLLFERIGFAGAMAVSGILPLVGMLMLTPLPGLPAQPQAARPSFWSVIGTIRLHGLVLCMQGVGFAVIGAFFTLLFLDRGWQGAGFGLTAFGVGFVLMRLLFGGLVDRLGGWPVAIASLAVEVVGQALIWATPLPELALLGAFLTGIGCSLIFPAMGREVVALVPPHLRGTAIGGFTGFQDLAYGLTGPVAGFLADRAGYGSVFLVGALAALAGLVAALAVRSRRRPA